MKLRVKCPFCGSIENLNVNAPNCSKCKKTVPVPTDACVYLYRQGSPYGIAGGFGVYVNGEPYGYIGNKETLCFPLNYGTYNFHCAVGMSRKCRDMQVTLSPSHRQDCFKVYIKPGFWANSFVIEPLDPAKLGLNFNK